MNEHKLKNKISSIVLAKSNINNNRDFDMEI